MSLSQRQRGDFIREKMGLDILHDLGRGKLTADPKNKKKPQAGDIDDLMRDLGVSGSTANIELAKHPYYLNAIEAWRKHSEAKREERRNK